MFGKEEAIQQLVPNYKIDALVRRENLDRYDDRLNIRVNMIDAYDLLMDFVAKHLSDPFYLDGIQRVSLRDKIRSLGWVSKYSINEGVVKTVDFLKANEWVLEERE